MRTRLLIILAILVLLLAACAGQATEGTPPLEPTTPQEAETPETAATDGGGEAGAADSEEILATRPLQPTATPDFISREVTELVESTRLSGSTFLGVTADNWINLAISLLIVALAYVIGTLLTRGLIRWVVRRTSPEFGQVLRESIGPRLKWLVVIPAFYFATIRLDFLSLGLKRLLADVYFVLALLLVTLIVWTLIDLGYEYYRQRFAAVGRGDQIEPVLLLLMRIIRVFIIIVALSILFSHFGINITALAAALGVGGLAFSLAAQDTLADAISGFIILIDQPYRIGDRIEIQDEGTWGDVVEIGIRTTRIRTRDNRMVIVPNSIISKNQVVNYTFPDPRYRIQTHIGIGYGSDIESVRQLIVETVRQVEGVLPDKPVEALYVDRGESAMIFRVRWWLESYVDTRRMFDRVNTALEEVFEANGIDTPYPIHTMNLQVDQSTAVNLSQAFREESAGG
jgi:small-conductance mechanosensitive channel